MCLNVLVVDNRDSFTYNLVDYLTAETGTAPDVVDHKAVGVNFSSYDAIVISPGPGTPERPTDVGISADALDAGVPVLGVCLGHQLIASHFGGRIVRAPEPFHGRISSITHDGSELFDTLPAPVEVVRYHSLAVDDANFPPELEVTARTHDGVIMALRHRERPLWGVQFHPESIGADSGRTIIRNFIAQVRQQRCLDVESLGPQESAAIFEALFADNDNAFWLDDATGETTSYMGLIEDSRHFAEGDVFPWLAEQPTRPRNTTLAAQFQSGYVGYIGYEGQAWLGRVDRLVALDHRRARVEVMGPVSWVGTIRQALAEPPRLPEWNPSRATVQSRFDREGYLQRIRAAQEEIRAGETYEVCLTNQLSAEVSLDARAVYHRLRSLHPSQRCGYLPCDGVTLASSSPETFLTIRDRVATTKPIKGTRPRGATPDEDERLAKELVEGEKERAENLMIVDLVRHDLTRHARPGGTRVEKLFDVESYASVHQLVSTVTAELAEDASSAEVIRDAFPGGSMTGAPKIRTMEILRRLEEGPRGIYSGAFGYFADDGSVDLAMTIRTLVIEENRVTYGVGGAILHQSDPIDEYEETVVKARPFRDVL